MLYFVAQCYHTMFFQLQQQHPSMLLVSFFVESDRKALQKFQIIVKLINCVDDTLVVLPTILVAIITSTRFFAFVYNSELILHFS